MKKLFENKESIPYQEFIGEYLDFFDENGEITKFEIRKIRNNCFVLRKKEEGKISDLEIPIIEVLALNFPNSENYVFSKEDWKNFWLKYGGYLPSQIKIDKDFLSIKEAREIFSKLPSEFEKILFYFFFPNRNIYDFFLKIKEQPSESEIDVSTYFEYYANSETIKKIVYLINLFRRKLKTNERSIDELVSLERENSIKREKFFGRRREPELYNDEEKKDFSKLISDLNYLIEVRNHLIRLDREFYNEIEKIEKILDSNKAFISRSLLVFFKDLINYYSFPLYLSEIYSEKSEIPSKEAEMYFLALIIKKLPFASIKESIESSKSIEEFILKTFLKEYGLEKILKFKPKFIITPPTNTIPIAYFYRNLLKFANIILEENNSQLSEKIIPPKFILFDFINKDDWNYFKNIKINNQIACLYFLNLFKLYSLEEIKTKAELNEFNLKKR